jgi:hypothetical protein
VKLAPELARSPPPPFAQPEQSRVANVPIAKSRVLAAPVLRIVSRKGFTGIVSFENFLIIILNLFSMCIVRHSSDACHRQTERSGSDAVLDIFHRGS